MQVKPVFACDGMANRVACMGVQHHFSITHGTRCEIDQASLVVTGFGSCKFWRCLVDDPFKVCPAFAFGSACVMIGQYRHFDSRTFAAYLVKFDCALAICDERRGFGTLRAELDI